MPDVRAAAWLIRDVLMVVGDLRLEGELEQALVEGSGRAEEVSRTLPRDRDGAGGDEGFEGLLVVHLPARPRELLEAGQLTLRAGRRTHEHPERRDR